MKKKIANLSLFLLACCLCAAPAKAQQTLNLDFEKLSIEGIARPWGWDLITGSETKVQLDNSIKHQGSYSLKMDGVSNTGNQVLAFSLESFELKNKTVLVEGWIKTNALKGSASLIVSYSTPGDSAEKIIKSTPVMNAAEWTLVTLSVNIPGNAASINLGVQHEGTGAAWFDDLSLSVNGKKKQELEVAASFTPQQINWLGRNSYMVNSVDASGAGSVPNDKDLDFIRPLYSNARIIALGESTHGTSEFFRLKNRVLEYCVNHLGVTVFAIEDHPLVVARVNRYVMGGAGTARSSMQGMLGVWQTKEVHGLIEWMRGYNDLHPGNKITFTGFDIQNHSLAIDSLYSFLAKRSPVLEKAVKELLADLLKNGMNSYTVSDSVKLAWFDNAKTVLERVSAQSDKWLYNAKSRNDSLDIYWGIQYANLVKQFAENTWRGHVSLYRDIAMAENVSWAINVYQPGAKALLWAHDVHISRGEHPKADLNIYYGKSMGAQLSKKYGGAYKSFGLFTYRGEYSCYVSYSNFKVTDCPLYTSPAGSLDQALHQVASGKKIPALFLDLGKARTEDWLSRSIPVRFANHVNIEYGYWTQFSIPYQFDGIFFIDKTSSAKSYARD